MITRTIRLSLAALALSLLPTLASAGERVPFDTKAFEAAKAGGKSILVDVYAAWCSTCQAQHKHLTELTAKPEYKDMVVFEVDFDNQKDEQKALGVQNRSTLIAFKGSKETGRSVSDTSKDSIEALMKSAL